MRKIAFTSITNNYLPKARALAHSIKRHSPEVSFVLLLAEDADESLLRPDDPFDRILTVGELGIPDLAPWLFMHTVVEVCTALKGHALAHLLDSGEDTAVFYFDPDMVVTSRPDSLFAHFEDASILLTPHTTEPETTLDGILDNEISPLRYGVYNLGFLAVRNTPPGLKFARWWEARLHDFCYDDIEHGIFTDQRWVDLGPALFDGVKVLRDPAYNVATWNLTHRRVSGSLEGGLLVNGRPLVFYHFSGFDSGAQEVMLNKYGQSSPVLKDLREWYIEECRRLGQDEVGALPWAYSRFDNGEPITNAQRKLYRSRPDLQQAFPDPFSTGDPGRSYFHWYVRGGERPAVAAPVPGAAGRILVLALDEESARAEDLFALLGRTARREAVEVAAPAAVREKLSAAAPGLRFAEVGADEAAPRGREAWMLRQIEETRGPGLIFVQLGLGVPDLWDLRLGWAAAEAGVATVSPLYDGVPMTSPFHTRAGPARGPARGEDVDTAVFNSEERDPVDAPRFLYECFYVNTELARAALGRSRDGARPHAAGLVGLARQCAREGFSHVIATDIYVAAPPAGHRDLVERPLDVDVESYLRRDALGRVRARVEEVSAARSSRLPSVSQRASRRHLHVMHAWGGGLEHWVRSFCRSDSEHVNMVLKPAGQAGEYGSVLSLYAGVDDAEPLAWWSLPVPIKATAPANLTYRRIVERIVEDYGIDVVFVSSLIGHSMDVLRTAARTVYVCHDFFPLTPELYMRSWHLAGNRVADFSVDEVYDRGPLPLFPNYSRAEAKAAHRAFRDILGRRGLSLVAPSPSARRIYLDLAPELNPRDITVIPHASAGAVFAEGPPPYEPGGRLRVVIPGRLAPEKGRALLEKVLPELTGMADVLLLGCSMQGTYLADLPGVQAVAEYRHEDLPQLLRDFRPHLALLLSEVPETFSFTLSELFAAGVPPVGVRIGSLADRITDGFNGFLVSNTPADLLGTLGRLDANRAELESVRRRLEEMEHRTEAEVVLEYELLLRLPRYSARAAGARPLPPSAYRHIPRAMGRRLPLIGAARPSVRSVDPDYCALRGEGIFLHPPAPGAPDTEITFPGVPLAGAARLTAEVCLEHELAPEVAVSALVTDSETGAVLGRARVGVAYGEVARLDLALADGAAARRADITFSSNVSDPAGSNHCAWLVVRQPQLVLPA